MSTRPDSHLHVSRPPQSRISRIDLGSIGSGLGSRVSPRLQPLEETARIAEGGSTVWNTSSPATGAAHQVTERANKINIQRPGISVRQQPRPGREEKPIPVKHESPWKTYKKGYELKLDKYITVAVHLFPRSGKVAIKEYARSEAEQNCEMLNTVRHVRFIKALELFEWDQTCYAVFEHVFVSLVQVVACPAYPTERQLAAILGQVSWHEI